MSGVEEDYRVILRTSPKHAPALWGLYDSIDETVKACKVIQEGNPSGTILVLHAIDRADTVYLFHGIALIPIDSVEFSM